MAWCYQKLNHKCGKALNEGTLKGVIFGTWFYFFGDDMNKPDI